MFADALVLSKGFDDLFLGVGAEVGYGDGCVGSLERGFGAGWEGLFFPFGLYFWLAKAVPAVANRRSPSASLRAGLRYALSGSSRDDKI